MMHPIGQETFKEGDLLDIYTLSKRPKGLKPNQELFEASYIKKSQVAPYIDPDNIVTVYEDQLEKFNNCTSPPSERINSSNKTIVTTPDKTTTVDSTKEEVTNSDIADVNHD